MAQRLEAVAGRLAAIPDALDTARSVLGDCPRIHLETAVGQFRGTAAFIKDQVPALCAEVPAMMTSAARIASRHTVSKKNRGSS